jgi:hypothetical protein
MKLTGYKATLVLDFACLRLLFPPLPSRPSDHCGYLTQWLELQWLRNVVDGSESTGGLGHHRVGVTA